MPLTPTSRLSKAQRTLRESPLLAVRTQEAVPELTDELGEAITRLLAAERKAARIMRERFDTGTKSGSAALKGDGRWPTSPT